MKEPKGPARDFAIVHATDTGKCLTVVLGTADTPAEALAMVSQYGQQSWAKKRTVRIGVDEVRR